LARGLKNAESQTRTETMVTFGKVCKGMGGAAFNVHKDIYKVGAVLRNDVSCLPGFPLSSFI
jgi:hypothetical protein